MLFDCVVLCICGVVMGGVNGLFVVLMDWFVVFEIIVINGIGIDVVDFDCVWVCGIYVMMIFDVLIDDVVDMVLGLILMILCDFGVGEWIVCVGCWGKMV